MSFLHRLLHLYCPRQSPPERSHPPQRLPPCVRLRHLPCAVRGNTTIRGVQRVVLLVVFGLLLGAVLTGIAGALPGSHDVNALTWLGSVSTVAALVVAVGIYRVQQTQSDVARSRLSYQRRHPAARRFARIAFTSTIVEAGLG